MVGSQRVATGVHPSRMTHAAVADDMLVRDARAAYIAANGVADAEFKNRCATL